MATDAVIGKIVVNVEARIDKLEKQLNRGRRSVKDFGNSTASLVTSSLAKLNAAVGLGSVVSFGAMTAAVAKSTAEIDNLAKTSQKIGIATEALAGLRHAANLTGVETQTLDNSLGKMTIRISEARKGTGEAKDVIKELGLDIERIATLAPEKQFAEIASAMQNVENHADKVRIATKLFEEEGAKLVNTMALGKSGLAAAAIEAEKLGLAIKAEDAAKVEKLADAWDRFKKVTGVGFNELTIAIAPAAAEILEGLTYAVRDIKGMYKSLPKSVKEPKLGFVGTMAGIDAAKRLGGLVSDRYTQRSIKQSREEGKITDEELRLRGWSEDQIKRRQLMIDRKLTDAKEYELQAQKKQPPLKLDATSFVGRLAAPNSTTNRIYDSITGAIEKSANAIGKAIPDRITTESAIDKAMFRFGHGLELFRQAGFNMQQRMDSEKETKSMGPRAESGIIEQGTSEAFQALRKNLYKTDDKQRELVAINKAMLKAGVEQKDGINELVNWFKGAVMVGT